MSDLDGKSMADKLPDGVEQAKMEMDEAWGACSGSSPLKCVEAFKEAIEYTGVVALDKLVDTVAPKYGSVYEQSISKPETLDM